MQSQRYSFQREKIYEAVCGTRAHPTAEMVFQQLKPQMPHLSLGTVYRNLHQMAQEGRLQELSGPVARFDGNVMPHTHFCCNGCGAVSDAALPYDQGLDRAAEAEGFRVLGHSLLFHGYCPKCVTAGMQEPDAG